MSESYENTPQDEALRQRVRDFLSGQKFSVAQAGKRANIPQSTLAAWLNGTYRGDVANISMKVRVWLDAQEALSAAGKFASAVVPFAETPTARLILDVFEYSQSTADIGVVVGAAGIGKTMAAVHYVRTRPSVWHLTVDPSLRRAHGVLSYVADAVGVSETRADRLSRAIAARLAGTDGLLIVDEAQHLSTEGMDQLRGLHDRAQIGLVIMGNQGVWTRLEGGGRQARFAQLFSRVGMRLTREKSTIGDVEAILDAAGIDALDQRKMLRVIAGKPGALRGMMKTIRLARMVTMASDEELSVAAISAAFGRLTGASEASS
jgi:DNA transposition AAA+ family ATPase